MSTLGPNHLFSIAALYYTPNIADSILHLYLYVIKVLAIFTVLSLI